MWYLIWNIKVLKVVMYINIVMVKIMIIYVKVNKKKCIYMNSLIRIKYISICKFKINWIFLIIIFIEK